MQPEVEQGKGSGGSTLEGCGEGKNLLGKGVKISEREPPQKAPQLWSASASHLARAMNLSTARGRKNSELGPAEGLAVLPVRGSDVVIRQGPAIAGGDEEGERLAAESCVALPVLAPVAGQRLPPGHGALDGDGVHVASAADIGDEDKVEESVAVDGVVNTAGLLAGNPVRVQKRQKKD